MTDASPLGTLARVATRDGPLPTGAAWEALIAEGRPVLFKGAANDWALVKAGKGSATEAAEKLKAWHSGDPVVVYRGAPEIGGRFFYTDAVDGFNFKATREPLAPVLDEILGTKDDAGAGSVYIGSTDASAYFPGFRAENPFDLAALHPMLTAYPGLASLWIGNRTTAACHYDYSHNIAVAAVGRRRFTLFPPDQAANLYPGPLEPTPGGQVVSMVDFTKPDLVRFPRFAEALKAGEVADMEAGDVLVYPAMWWHNVEALDAFNVLVNYWWNAVPAYIDSPQVTLLHALLSLRDRPADEKAAWKGLFDYYVFGDAAHPRAHLPDGAQGPLAPIDDMTARRLRALIMRKLQR
ncbi:cupin-like domain-containing protein [Gimibacter soli]|uniref:Cupin-like domain-containing protein n=1 Tax=Gimibacter soli TaxID=3024400 RepID=A0AAF0BKU6_9PROT|nr:cupin-like domain-containing protein [Gimibacter soli]WCL54689.1 cupin-like domain-containing protein [Gimibacter soli]